MTRCSRQLFGTRDGVKRPIKNRIRSPSWTNEDEDPRRRSNFPLTSPPPPHHQSSSTKVRFGYQHYSSPILERRPPPELFLELSEIKPGKRRERVQKIINFKTTFFASLLFALSIYLEDSESDNTIRQNLYRSYLQTIAKPANGAPHGRLQAQMGLGHTVSKQNWPLGADNAMPAL